MILEHQFSVPAPLDEVWKAVLDPERVAPCMPGATLTEVEGDSFRGSVKVKLGPISLTYKGSGEFKEKNEQAKRVVIEASGKDARGGGTASATVTVTLTASGDKTDGAVHTDLNITGRPAQFGRGMISEVAGKLLDSFAQCLADKLGGAHEAPAAQDAAASSAASGSSGVGQTPSTGAGGSSSTGGGTSAAGSTATGNAASSGAPQDAAAIDLLDYAGTPVIKRLAPVIGGALVVLVFVALRRKRRKKKRG
ncbi:carbon monoxide dehydrogenase subunit G [Tamaricihabitans halophyticus]|uniref:Carbon monoxide dehydrogenase subunit G n=1 Tax=Tamaricihabitans halophyticus TaxID=1262583 RepID=A0A4R2QZF1_9PSEU|nr:SRPBCC family protein [Tamaricihabitans halophyticus]TCP55067.1 carbon monoxide dehydrogenase subunit G [Tamaricihabitans halophyticus]